MSINLTKYIVLLNLATAYSFGIMQFSNIKEEDVVKGINKALSDYNKKSVRHRHANNVADRGSRKNLHNNFEHKRLIKSIIPHGEEVKFDTKHARYVPLMRLHKKKSIFIKDNDEYISQGPLKVGASNDEERNLTYQMPAHYAKWWEKFKALKYKNKENKHLEEINIVRTTDDDNKYFVLRNVKQSSNDNIHQDNPKGIKHYETLRSNKMAFNKTMLNNILKNVKVKIKTIWQEIKDYFSKKKHNQTLRISKNTLFDRMDPIENEEGLKSVELSKNWKADSKIVERLKNILKRQRGGDLRSKHDKENKQSRDTKIMYLRTLLNKLGVKPKLRARSGEDEPSPSNLFDNGRRPTQRPDLWLPKYSFSNYWTYEKELYQDECKGKLIKIAGVCADAPPH